MNEFEKGVRALADILFQKIKCVENNPNEYRGYIDDEGMKMLEQIVSGNLPAALLYEQEKEQIVDEPEVATNLP